MDIFMQDHKGVLETPAGVFYIYRGVKTYGQVALLHSVQMLRIKNVQFLVQRGVTIDASTASRVLVVDYALWDKNRELFNQTPAILKAYDLPPSTIRC